MHVSINGIHEAVADGLTLADLLQQRGTDPRRVAIEVNKELVVRAEYGTTRINEGDRIEIVTFVGGG
jgi:sulfur carrier protein